MNGESMNNLNCTTCKFASENTCVDCFDYKKHSERSRKAKMKTKIETNVTTKSTITTNLTGDDIVALIKECPSMAACFEKKGTFKTTVQVPTGGDYSGMELVIGEDVDIIVTQISETYKTK